MWRAPARVQQARFARLGAVRMRTNAECSGRLLEEIASPDAEGAALMRQAADALHLSARGFHRTLRVARTLADLDGEEVKRRRKAAVFISRLSNFSAAFCSNLPSALSAR